MADLSLDAGIDSICWSNDRGFDRFKRGTQRFHRAIQPLVLAAAHATRGQDSNKRAK